MDRRREIGQLTYLLGFDADAKGAVLEEIAKGDVDWATLVGVANVELLTPALRYALKEEGVLEGLEDRMLVGFLDEVYRANEARNLGILEQLVDIHDILAPRGIEPLILKGGAVISEGYYPAIGIRLMNDIDIMIRPERFEEGLALLKEHGYEEFGRDMGASHHHAPRISKAGFPAAVEPHRRIILDGSVEYIPYDEETTRYSSHPDLPHARVLEPTWHLYHAFLHAAVVDKHHKRWRLALRYLYDFSRLAHRFGEDVDWKLLEELAIRYGHRKILQDYLFLAQSLFGLEAPLPAAPIRSRLFVKKCLWQSTLEPNTKLYKFYEAYTDFDEIYSYEKLKSFYGLTSPLQYPFALVKYFLYHGRKHLIEEAEISE
ncbi:nucleotidyltransferase domain-containing protein [Hydrogenimonas sp.]